MCGIAHHLSAITHTARGSFGDLPDQRMSPSFSNARSRLVVAGRLSAIASAMSPVPSSRSDLRIRSSISCDPDGRRAAVRSSIRGDSPEEQSDAAG
jgi:hypothetical protein